MGEKITDVEDLTSIAVVKAYMSESKSLADWDQRELTVRRANNGFPNFWTPKIVTSGLMNRIKDNLRQQS